MRGIALISTEVCRDISGERNQPFGINE
jgi:hypothetical protein